MNFPLFWAKASSEDLLVWRWSSRSLAEAQSLANEAARQLAERVRLTGYPPKRGGYYPDRPFREQVLREIKDDTGEVSAVITRNSYGCLVLNTARVMFVDIDIPEPKPSGGLFSRLFGKPELPDPALRPEETVQKVENWTRRNPEWGWRIYRTRSGFRLLATQALVEATSEPAKAVFQSLGADPLYQKLCESQKCFRARLTPKPWRCGLHRKPERWPWADERTEALFKKWETKYQTCSSAWATCVFVKHVGNPHIHPEVDAIVKLHDEPTRAASNLQLA